MYRAKRYSEFYRYIFQVHSMFPQLTNLLHLCFGKFGTREVNALQVYAPTAINSLLIVEVDRSFFNMSPVVAAPIVALVEAAWFWVSSVFKFKGNSVQQFASAFMCNPRVSMRINFKRPVQTFIGIVGRYGFQGETEIFISAKLISIHRCSYKAMVDLSRHAMQLAGGFFILQHNP